MYMHIYVLIFLKILWLALQDTWNPYWNPACPFQKTEFVKLELHEFTKQTNPSILYQNNLKYTAMDDYSLDLITSLVLVTYP